MEKALSIDALERELVVARQELEKASANRLRAHDIEDEWHAEVTSLEKLIEVRMKRLGTPSVPASGPATEEERSDVADKTGEELKIEVHPLNRVEWINGLVNSSGSRGISPPEILLTAQRDAIKIHRNYPYIVLRELVSRGRIVKRNGRYYRK